MTLLNLGPGDEFLVAGRLVPAGSDGNTTYARSLRPGEEDSGEAVHIPAGHQLVIKPGDLSISSDETDAKSPKGRGGYAPVADTVWTWYRIVGATDPSFLMMVLAAARRLGATHVFWSATMEALEEPGDLAGIERRSTLFRALAMAEVTVISLSRGVQMLYRLEEKFDLGLHIPEEIDSLRATLKRMRNALEHIDERAVGEAKDGTADSAMSIFSNPPSSTRACWPTPGRAFVYRRSAPGLGPLQRGDHECHRSAATGLRFSPDDRRRIAVETIPPAKAWNERQTSHRLLSLCRCRLVSGPCGWDDADGRLHRQPEPQSEGSRFCPVWWAILDSNQ